MAPVRAAASEHRPSLRNAALELAEERLVDADLSPATVASALNVSVRTLYRAFAESKESLMAYVRRRRLELARLDLIAAGGALSVTEVAARWHFSDSSHFIRCFRHRFGMTPARMINPGFGWARRSREAATSKEDQ